MRIILFIVGLLFSTLGMSQTNPTDTTAQKERKAWAKGFGLSFGADYHVLRLDNAPVLLNANTSIGVNVVNGPALSAGIFIQHAERPLRFGLEATLSKARIEYDLGGLVDEKHDVYPFAIGLPITYGFSLIKSQAALPRLLVGLNPIFNITSFQDVYPTLRAVNPCVLIGFSKTMELAKSKMQIALYYNLGLLNLQSGEEQIQRNLVINSLYRDQISLRIGFN